jgi:hypothetical protein
VKTVILSVLAAIAIGCTGPSTGLDGHEVCSPTPNPSDEDEALAYRLVWEGILTGPGIAAPVTSWITEGTDQVDRTGHVVARWYGSFTCSDNWVDDLLIFDHWQITGHAYGPEDRRLDAQKRARSMYALAAANL